MSKKNRNPITGDLSFPKKQALTKLLSGYITPQRIQKMQTVLAWRTRHLCVVLEDIYQSHNASAVLRSCECFGVQDVHIIENKNTYQINPDVTLGASNWLSLYRYNTLHHNTAACLHRLKDKGYRIIATTPHKDDVLLEALPVDEKIALLFGTELGGLSSQAVSMADGYMKIPMVGFTESFNISVSVAISLYHLIQRIRTTVGGWELSEHEKTDILLQWMMQSVRNPEALVKHLLQTMESNDRKEQDT